MRDFPLSDLEQSQIIALKAVDLEEFSQLLSERLIDTLEPEAEGSGT